MKKGILRIISLILVVCILAGCSSSVAVHPLEEYVQEMQYHDGFTILQLTDIHWNSATQIGNGHYGSEAYLTKVINEAIDHAGKIDLIEITGDTFMLSTAEAVTSFIDFMESFEIPYAMIWGNHDREGKYNPNWISRKFLEAEHCMYTEVDNDTVHERGNYVINLVDGSGNAQWQVVNLDSGASYRKGAADMSLTYDFIRQDQLDWFAEEHALAGDSVPVVCYYHIAQADNDIAYEAVLSGAEGYISKFFKLETFAASKYAPVTEDIFAANNVKAVFSGHAHADDWTVTTPSGVTYGLGVKSGKELYYGTVEAGNTDGGFEVTEDFDLIGASLVTLVSSDGRFKLEHLYLNERNDGDFVMWVKY